MTPITPASPASPRGRSEEAIREALAWRAGADLPTAAPVLLERVRVAIARDCRRRVRRSWTAGLAAVAVVAVAVLGVGLLHPGARSSAPSTVGSGSPWPPGTQLQTITDYGISVSVPDQWPVYLTPTCSPRLADAVELSRVAMSCPGPVTTPDARPPATTVYLQPASGTAQGTPVTVHGEPGVRSESHGGTVDARRSYVLTLPRVGAQVIVVSADPVLAQRILDGARIAGGGPACANLSALTEVAVQREPGGGYDGTLAAPAQDTNRTVGGAQALAAALCALPEIRPPSLAPGGCVGPTTQWQLTFRAGSDEYPATVIVGPCRAVVGLGAARAIGPPVLSALASAFGWRAADQAVLAAAFADGG